MISARQSMRNALRAVGVVSMLGAVSVMTVGKLSAQLRRPVPMPPNLFNTIKLNDHLYVIAPSGPDTSNVGGNVGVCISDQGVLLVDANYFLDWRNGLAVPMAQAVVDEVKKLTPQPIRWVINTHHHGDHSGGDPVFGAFAMIVSHKNARDRILSGYENAAKNAPAVVTRAQQDLSSARAGNDSAKITDAQDRLSLAEMNLKMAEATDPKKASPTLIFDTELAFFLTTEEDHLYH